VQEFFESGEHINVAKRKTLEITDKMYRIQDGYIGLYMGSGKDRRLLVVMEAGTVFPLDLSEAYGGELWSSAVYYRALTDATVYAISKKQYERATHANKEIMEAEMNTAKRAQSLLMERMVTLLIGDVTKRLYMRLILLAAYLSNREGDSAVVKLPLTYVDIAESIGITRETVNRQMTKLQNKGLISVDKKIITINSVSRLEDLYKNT
jgi:CRP-like cAMP-binding protein